MLAEILARMKLDEEAEEWDQAALKPLHSFTYRTTFRLCIMYSDRSYVQLFFCGTLCIPLLMLQNFMLFFVDPGSIQEVQQRSETAALWN